MVGGRESITEEEHLHDFAGETNSHAQHRDIIESLLQ
jgi:hypothetical protein